MISLTVAAAIFILIHLLVAGTRLRDGLVQRLGEGPYMGLFSLASLGVIVWLGYAFNSARLSEDNLRYWGPTAATRIIHAGLQAVSLLLIVSGLTTPNPTSVGQLKTLERADAVRGVLRITRHPFLWGVGLWSLGHLLVSGRTASFILFGAMGILAIGGTMSIDAKRRRALGEIWEPFSRQSSNLPFAAIAAGRQSLKFGEIGVWRILASAAQYANGRFGEEHIKKLNLAAGQKTQLLRQLAEMAEKKGLLTFEEDEFGSNYRFLETAVPPYVWLWSTDPDRHVAAPL